MPPKYKYLTEKESKVISSFIKDLREKVGDDIVFIKLFGSKARGDFDKNSDIDIFILVKRKKGVRDQISDISAEYFFETDIPISTVVYSVFEYKKNKALGSFFFENVEKEGVTL